MKKMSSTAKLAVMTLFVFGLMIPVLAADPDLVVLPVTYDFGDVEVGELASTLVTVANLDVTEISLNAELYGNPDYAITSDVPPSIYPDTIIYIEVTFSPSAEGCTSAELLINGIAATSFEGVGICTQPSPVTIEAILAFFDESIAAGTLQGTGHLPALSETRSNIFKNTLLIAASMIDGGRVRVACLLLNFAYLRSDGLIQPLDFVDGEATAELNGMIGQLMADMGCQ